LFKKKNKQKIV